jgi:hypothetical protein
MEISVVMVGVNLHLENAGQIAHIVAMVLYRQVSNVMMEIRIIAIRAEMIVLSNQLQHVGMAYVMLLVKHAMGTSDVVVMVYLAGEHVDLIVPTAETEYYRSNMTSNVTMVILMIMIVAIISVKLYGNLLSAVGVVQQLQTVQIHLFV